MLGFDDLEQLPECRDGQILDLDRRAAEAEVRRLACQSASNQAPYRRAKGALTQF